MPGEIDPEGIHAALVERAGDLSGAAPEIRDGPGAAHQPGEPVEERAIEGLVRELVEEARGVRVRDRVVGAPDGIQGRGHRPFPVRS
jgi:hypothetical protein